MKFKQTDNPAFDELRHRMMAEADILDAHDQSVREAIAQGVDLPPPTTDEVDDAADVYNSLRPRYVAALASRQASDEVHGFTPVELPEEFDEPEELTLGQQIDALQSLLLRQTIENQERKAELVDLKSQVKGLIRQIELTREELKRGDTAIEKRLDQVNRKAGR